MTTEKARTEKSRLCPLCKDSGRFSELIPRQINADEAVYVCDNLNCPYPVGFSSETVAILCKELQPNNTVTQEAEPYHVQSGVTLDFDISDLQIPVLDVDPEMDEVLREFLDQQH